MRQLKNNARVGLFAKLGRGKYNPQLAAKLVPAEPRIERAQYVRWVDALVLLFSHKVADRLDLNRQDAKCDLPGCGDCYARDAMRHERWRQDAAPRVLLDIDWDTLVDESGFKDLLDKIARSMNDRGTAYFEKILRTNPPPVGDVAQRISAFKKSNIELIKNAGHDMISSINETLQEGNARGTRHEVLAKQIQERTQIGGSRAKRIARDQTLKYNASVHQAQAEASGVTEYTWSTAKDKDVRPMHKALEGKRFRYDDPPVTNEDGDHNNPGEDYNCRCNAIPVISLFEGIDDEEPEAETAPMLPVATSPADTAVEPIDPLQNLVNTDGIYSSEYLRSGMRDLTEHRAAYVGATPAQVQQIAAGKIPTMTSSKPFAPVRVNVETDKGVKRVFLADGRHRMTAAKEAGATHVNAVITEYGPRGGVKRRVTGLVRI